jgi:hypothetical protein
MLFTSGEVEVEEEDGVVATGAWREENREDMAGSVRGYGWSREIICASERRGDESDCSCPSVTLVRVKGEPVGENGGEGGWIKVVKVGFLNKNGIRNEREGENVSGDAVMAFICSRGVVIGRYAVRIICGYTRVRDVGV